MVSDPDDADLRPRRRATGHRVQGAPSARQLEPEQVGEMTERLGHAFPRNSVSQKRFPAQASRIRAEFPALRRSSAAKLLLVDEDFDTGQRAPSLSARL